MRNPINFDTLELSRGNFQEGHAIGEIAIYRVFLARFVSRSTFVVEYKICMRVFIYMCVCVRVCMYSYATYELRMCVFRSDERFSIFLHNER